MNQRGFESVVEDLRAKLFRKTETAVLELLPRTAFQRPWPGDVCVLRKHSEGLEFLSLCAAPVVMLLHPEDEYWRLDFSVTKFDPDAFGKMDLYVPEKFTELIIMNLFL